MATTKRIEASILLDGERYEQLKEYAKRKGTENMDEAVTLIVNTGLSRQGSSSRYTQKMAEQRRAEKGTRVRAKSTGVKAAKTAKVASKKTKDKTRPAAKKVSATAAKAAPKKAAGKKVAKTNAPVAKPRTVVKSGATVSRIAPQRPQAPAATQANGTPVSSVQEAAEA